VIISVFFAIFPCFFVAPPGKFSADALAHVVDFLDKALCDDYLCLWWLRTSNKLI